MLYRALVVYCIGPFPHDIGLVVFFILWNCTPQWSFYHSRSCIGLFSFTVLGAFQILCGTLLEYHIGPFLHDLIIFVFFILWNYTPQYNLYHSRSFIGLLSFFVLGAFQILCRALFEYCRALFEYCRGPFLHDVILFVFFVLGNCTPPWNFYHSRSCIGLLSFIVLGDFQILCGALFAYRIGPF